MSDFVLTTSGDVPDHVGWQRLNLGDGSGSEVELLPALFDSWRPSPAGEAILSLAVAAYSIDKLVARSSADDGWTRRIALDIPMRPGIPSIKAFEKPLNFLTGDTWQLGHYELDQDPFGLHNDDLDLPQALQADAVSLFSGGLDSLCGVIDFLEVNPEKTLVLVSHYDGGQASSKQIELRDHLADHYGSERVIIKRIWTRPGATTKPSNLASVENTTRGRSLLFIATALAIADSIGPAVPVIVPENGYIALNVPLTRARVGSASTRTTHPHYLRELQTAAGVLGVSNPISNPYIHSTKGEMLLHSSNRDLLAELTPLSISCSHPEIGRWQQRIQGNCGYCFPCMIRQASVHAAGLDRGEYAWDVLNDPELLNPDTERGADLRAVMNGIFSERPDRDVLRNGPLPGDRLQHVDTWRRGNQEMASWLLEGAGHDLRRVIARIGR